jgi:hypothetical protein
MYNINAMSRLLLFGLALLPFLAGCIPLPVGSKHPYGMIDQSSLDAMIGEDKKSILLSFGRPDVVFSNEKSSYLIYGAYGTEHQALLLVWVPVAGQSDPEGTLYCVLLEFDEENIFRRYKINTHSRIWSSKTTASDCALSFLNPEEYENMDLLRKKAIQGEPKAQWQLYKNLPIKENIIWLCYAADQGLTSARNELGMLYYYGTNEYRKITKHYIREHRKFAKIDVQADLPRSCMWFHLAGQVRINMLSDTHESESESTINEDPEILGVSMQRYCAAMSQEQQSISIKLLEEWKPGKCEKDLLQ